MSRESAGLVRRSRRCLPLLAHPRTRHCDRSTVASVGTRKSLCRITDPRRARSSTRAVFHTVPLTVSELGLAFGLASAVFFGVELEKLVLRAIPWRSIRPAT